MRIDIRSSNRRHVKKHIGTWRVFLNGRDITYLTVSVDTRVGIARCMVPGADKNIMQVDPHNPDRIWIKEYRGRIRLRRRPAKRWRGTRARR